MTVTWQRHGVRPPGGGSQIHILIHILSTPATHLFHLLRRTDPGTRAAWLTHPTARRRFGLCCRRTGSFVLRCRSGSRGSHGGLRGRSEIIATLNRPFCGVGALPLALWTAPHDNGTRVAPNRPHHTTIPPIPHRDTHVTATAHPPPAIIGAGGG